MKLVELEQKACLEQARAEAEQARADLRQAQPCYVIRVTS